VNAEELKELREKQLALTQQELADALNVSFATVNRWENGRSVNKIPEDTQRLLECLRALVEKSSERDAQFTLREIKDAMKHTGAMGVVSAAVIGGVLTGGLVGALISSFSWLSGIAGIGGWRILPYFKKLRKGGRNEETTA